LARRSEETSNDLLAALEELEAALIEEYQLFDPFPAP